MKKILFIMILATTFIPVMQIGASSSGMNKGYKVQTLDSQISLNANSENIDVSDIKNQFQPEKIKAERGINKIRRTKELIPRKSFSGKKKDRLLGIFLLAYGGKR